ncbi:hypothetical protein LEMLEM_LOCUS13306, partial [Lemmus lemmus]
HKGLYTYVSLYTSFVDTNWAKIGRETADAVAQVLLDHISPRFGVPQTIQMDNGLIKQQLAKLSIELRYLPSHLHQGTDACHLEDDSTWDTFPATPLTEHDHLALPFPTSPRAHRKKPYLSYVLFSKESLNVCHSNFLSPLYPESEMLSWELRP